MNKTTLAVSAAAGGAIAGAIVGTLVICPMIPMTAASFPTHRPEIKAASAQALDDCNPFPFTANKHPTKMYQIRFKNVPFDVRYLNPEVTVMDVTSAPWTDGDPLTSKPYAGGYPNNPHTPLDLDLDLGAPTQGSKPSQVLIKYVVDDMSVPFIADPFAIISSDSNRKMFCKFAGGYKANSATFVVNYLKPVPNQKTFGNYNVGLTVPAADGSYQLPIYLDPEVENNGIN